MFIRLRRIVLYQKNMRFLDRRYVAVYLKADDAVNDSTVPSHSADKQLLYTGATWPAVLGLYREKKGCRVL